MVAPPAPTLTFLATALIEVGPAVEIGPTRQGVRRIIPIVGGSVEGPHLCGVVLAGGADFQVLRSDTLTELEAKYAIEIDDGTRLFVTNIGVRSGAPEHIARLVRGEPVDPALIYFRSSPRIEAPAGRWAWLNERTLVGVGERHPAEVRLHLFVVE